jgi:hypothetical protein
LLWGRRLIAEFASRNSEATVKAHISHVLAKLGMSNRVQAAILVHDAGLAEPNWPAGLSRSRPAAPETARPVLALRRWRGNQRETRPFRRP